MSDVLLGNKKTINDTDFWKQIDMICDGLQPALALLRQADADAIMVGKIWKKMNIAHQHFTDLESEHPEFKGTANMWMARWDRQHHPIYSVAYALHPDHNESNPLAEPSIQSDVDKVLKQHYPNTSDRAQVKAALNRYYSRQKCFSAVDADGNGSVVWDPSYLKETAPWEWWHQFQTDEPMLAPFACRVLQIGIASSACERLFSKWGYILSKYRTRLSLLRQHKLLYLFHNWRMLEKGTNDMCYRSDSDEEI